MSSEFTEEYDRGGRREELNLLSFFPMFKAIIKCLEDREFFILLTSSTLLSETSKDNFFEKIFFSVFTFVL